MAELFIWQLSFIFHHRPMLFTYGKFKKKEKETGGIKIIQLAYLHVRHVCCRYGGWRDCAAWDEFRRRCSASLPNWMFPGQHLVLLLLGVCRSTSKAQVARGGTCIQLLALGVYCMLWQQVDQLPHGRHASAQRDLHISLYLTLILEWTATTNTPTMHKQYFSWLLSVNQSNLLRVCPIPLFFCFSL